MMPRRLAFLLVAAAAATAACGQDSDAAASASGIHTDSAGGLVIPPSTPYRPTEGEASTALVVTVAGDSTGSTTGGSACASGPAGVETVFWVDGIRSGKALPNERRYELLNGKCGLEPRMQAAVVGGAVNVFNDEGVHRLVFIRAGTTDTLQTMPFSMPGSMVATDRLTKVAGVVDVHCAQHPNEQAYIAVFDHPYFGVASSGDRVTLDAIPAGDYRVMTWHEGLTAPTTVPAKVGATGQTEIILR